MSDARINPLVAHMRDQLKLLAVQRAIFCPRTGQVLDVRTCVVINDSDGDPVFVMSQDGWAQAAAEPTTLDVLAKNGYAVDESTVKS